jgi:hypothetical protein
MRVLQQQGVGAEGSLDTWLQSHSCSHLECNLELLARQGLVAWAGIQRCHFAVSSRNSLVGHFAR